MNKSALKKFATEARRELLERIELQARKLGITADSVQKANVESSDAIFIDGRQLSDMERKQRNKLIARIKEIGFNRVIEETAYTWFNRFIALRFMEVNEYLPTKVRALSSTNPNSAEPDMMKEALSLDLPIDKEYVYKLKMENKTDELFKYLIKVHCNDLNRYMPFMFETIEDYTEILFPEGLLGKDSFVSKMTNVEELPEDTWEKIEVIGWLYQYYISDEKDRVFQSKSKYKAEEIPYATQLFTPDWIVQYMVQNSLGRYWTEAHPENESLISRWQYFIKHEEADFKEKIAPYVNKELKVEDIKCFDPAMGSGHILVYMFEVLHDIYSEVGYMEREIPRLIIENNLYGLDIDDRAYQLACFSVVMKALQYNKRFLRSIEREGLELHLAAIQETNKWNAEHIAYIAESESGAKFDFVQQFVEQYKNAKTFGSLIKVQTMDMSFLENRLNEIQSKPADNIFDTEIRDQVLGLLSKLIHQTKIMAREYDIVVMNPPYMGSGSMNKELSAFLKKEYPDSKSDLFASFMEVDHYLKNNGFYSAITQHSWMFLSSFEKLREKVIKTKFLDTMLHLGPRAFEEIGGEVVQSTTFVLRKTPLENCQGIYLRLIDERTASEKKQRTIEAVQNPSVSYHYSFNQENFSKVPGSPIAYWTSPNVIKSFMVKNKVKDIGKTRKGMATGLNEEFVRIWFEVDFHKIRIGLNRFDVSKSTGKWFPYANGGEFRKWYGNYFDVVNWENDGFRLKHEKNEDGRIRAVNLNLDYIFLEGLSWTSITSSNFSLRLLPCGFLFSSASNALFANEDNYFLLGLLNSKVHQYLSKVLNPTLNANPGDISKMPVIFDDRVNQTFIQEIIKIAKNDWDSYETSWDFGRHPLLIDFTKTIEKAFLHWKQFSEYQFQKVKLKEEELNRTFIEIYGLQNELTPEVNDKDITITKIFDSKEDIPEEMKGNSFVLTKENVMKQFISFAIGCSFGRYSLDEEGLIFAGGKFDVSRYKTFKADKDNILPILSGSYFEDDIVGRFVEFVRVTFSDETLEENLNFVADALGRKKNETARETLRRYFLNDFYKDHVKTYKKRPIYWLFTSGKEKAFNCLIYMHRYDKTTLSRIRTDYLHEVQLRMDAEKKDLLNIIEGDSTTKEISAAKKELKSLDKKIDELKAYDELLHHMADQQIEIDLDDGVKHNYELFKGLVAKI